MTAKIPLIAASLPAELLMREADRRKMGDRIQELRETSPWNQPAMAKKLHVSLRMYQKYEERGTTQWETVQRIARVHKADAYWIWSGKERGTTPALTPGVAKRLERIEDQLQELRTDLAELGVDLARDRAQKQKWQRRGREQGSSEGSAG